MKICPIIPEIRGVKGNTLMTVLAVAMYLAVVALVSFIISRYAANRFNGNKFKTAICFIGISVGIGALLFAFFGLSARALRGNIFCLILLASSYQDFKTRESDDCFWIMVLLAGLIGTEISALPGMLAGGIFVLLVTVISSVFSRKAIGGADIKMSAACAFLLGLERGVLGYMAGLMLFIIFNMFKGRNEGFPMIPYLSAAFMASYFI